MILLAVSLSGSLILILLVVVIALVIYILVQRRKQKKKHMLNPITGSNHSNSIHVDYGNSYQMIELLCCHDSYA